jgi:3-oxoacyl-[acyl-carrier-protein] synthase II
MRLDDAVTRDSCPVVVTGIGLATGLGPTRASTWAAIQAGRNAARVLEGDSNSRPHLGCPSELAEAIRRADDPREPALALLGVLTAEALADARLAGNPPPTQPSPARGEGFDLSSLTNQGDPSPSPLAGEGRGGGSAVASRLEDRLAFHDPARAAVLVGLSKGGIRTLARLHRMIRDPRIALGQIAALWPAVAPSAGADLVARESGFEGPRLAPVAACASGLVAVLQGVDLVRRGVCDIVLAGSADASLEPWVLAAFRRMRILAHDNDPRRAIRPWDRSRSGFVVGEGGALLVLERADRAAQRGVVPYVEIAGGALGADAYHETDLNPDPAGLAQVIRRALVHSGLSARVIDHVNVHGTATRANDPTECRALRLALGEAAERVACSANKSQIGHCLGAAGAVELAITCLSIRDGFLPPTLNLTDPDPACDLDATPLVGRRSPIRAALKLSIGFGGHLAVAVLRQI